MKRFIVISCSHSSTEVFLQVDNDTIFKNGRGVNLHHHTLSQAKKVLKPITSKVFKAYSKIKPTLSTLTDAVLVLPGVSNIQDESEGQQLLTSVLPSIVVSNSIVIDDTIAGLLANIGTFEGTIAISGSGASVFCGKGIRTTPKPNGSTLKLDGWGPILGDRGGGSYVGLCLLKEICHHIDEHTSVPDIGLHLFKQIGVSEPRSNRGGKGEYGFQTWFDDLLRKSPRVWRQKIADLATIVTEQLKRSPNDSIATKLVYDAASEIAMTINSAVNSNHADGLPVVCHGGMFRFVPNYFEEVRKRISSPSMVSLAEWRAILGGIAIALGDYGDPVEKKQLGVFLKNQKPEILVALRTKNLV